ncbi:hypothetical protein ALC57_04486 [Trachymyrmex cornetzi]|uniref:Uncharacterized protein n=1 Tax=Trachymyrmex cornetzi TaxID=471704 RepID=A0A195ED11_9HYME|nr:hypothetical protein ALC57_04486 [Trachymyrmex cornetzi]
MYDPQVFSYASLLVFPTLHLNKEYNIHTLLTRIQYYVCILTGSTSHIITVISLEPVASLRPSGENLQYQTSSHFWAAESRGAISFPYKHEGNIKNKILYSHRYKIAVNLQFLTPDPNGGGKYTLDGLPLPSEGWQSNQTFVFWVDLNAGIFGIESSHTITSLTL